MNRMLLIVVLFATLNTSSQQMTEEETVKMKQAFSSVPMNTFRFLGNQIMCKMSDPDDEYACWRIGKVKLNDLYAPTSEPWQEIPQANGVVASVFIIVANDEYEAYWVIGHKNGIIESIQLTGNYPDEQLNFAGIMLADNEDKVKNILGPRYSVSDVPEINGTVWDYAPFRISIEFKGDVVYSIRISK
ncbi:MAG: hypothetical protein HWE13_10705 [Gammaproteobacteria bacterium]|nr:hypothetical protein [Gammaproteobacteria bacterium]